MDLDTTRTRHAYERIIRDFSDGRTNILIGTQMVTKGLDFGNVSVVGILNADNMLNYPDFRAYEHAFMMMSQVGGRAGRRGKQGLAACPGRRRPAGGIQPDKLRSARCHCGDREAGGGRGRHYCAPVRCL